MKTSVQLTNLLSFKVLPAFISIALHLDPVFAVSMENGKKLFDQSCSGCHASGQNLIPFFGSKSLLKEALEANGYNNEEKIVEIIKNGKGIMSAYGEFLDSKGKLVQARFTHPEMNEIANYVLNQANNGWATP